MKLLILVSIISGCFVVPSTSQVTCTTCGWGMVGLDVGSTVLKRFADDEASADTTWANLIGFGLNGVTADAACNTHNACGDNSTCTNLTTNYFECNCDQYFTPNRTNVNFNCADIDECDLLTHNCSNNATCNNTSPGFDCTCNTGYTGNGTYCEDVDECTNGSDNCADVGGNCTNTDGSFTCVCDTGYSGDGVNCTDIDECAAGTANCDNNANCTNTNGSFTCTCNTGYSGDGVTCDDINECTDGSHDCDTNANCTNTNGSFTCACNTGYTGDGRNCSDIDECTTGTNTCGTNGNCTNTNGSYTCECDTGYTGNGVNCTDIDECATNTDNCSDTGANCTNTDGSYTCQCDTGYTGDGFNCTDIDECTTGTNNCDANANCTNTDGSFTCQCDTGYTDSGGNCTDIDECALATDNCDDTGANCTNTDGSFTCQCNTGYSGDGVNCTDIDECTDDTDNCAATANCTNTVGSFDCGCDTGYTGDGVNCTDIDECATSAPCDANANCTNTNGSYTCECQAGYTGDGLNCTENDECASNPCDSNANCTDLVNDFNCTCNPGYSGNGTYCEDIDECTANTDGCHDNATCANTAGSFTCTCDTGFTGNGTDCQDVDECSSSPCDTNANCTNTDGSFNCACNTGYSGDGVTTCERQRQTLNLTFYITMDSVNYNTTFANTSSAYYIDNIALATTAIRSFVTGRDASAIVDDMTFSCNTSADGLGYAECQVNLYLNNTNVEENTYLSNVNLTTENTLSLSASADECTLGVDGCGADYTCVDTPYLFCCIHDIGGRFDITVDETWVQAYQDSSNEVFTNRSRLVSSFMNDVLLPPMQNRSCQAQLSTSCDVERILQGSVIHVLGLLLNGATFSLQDISDELRRRLNDTTSFGTIIGAGDFDECIESYAEFRNCSALAECLNFAGTFTCQCNATYYDNGTSPGEICINPISVDCAGNIMNVSILSDYYSQQNISLDALHLADETCNRTTHSSIIGDSIEFSVNINECNTSLAYSSDNTSIVASNYITNLPSSGVFTGLEIMVPFECSMPVDLNLTVGLNGSVDTVVLPNVVASGEFDLRFQMYTNNSFASAYDTSKTYGSSDTLYAQVSVENNINGISVKVDRCYGTPTSSRTDSDQFSFLENGCSNGQAAEFNMINNGDGSAQFSFKMFFFRQVNAVYLHCEAQVCTPSCAQTCSGRKRRNVPDSTTPPAWLSLLIRIDPNDITYDGEGNVIGVNVPGGNNNVNDDTSTQDIALPIMAAVLAFVLIVLLALLVFVLVRKRRSSKDKQDLSHVNMHAIGVQPPAY